MRLLGGGPGRDVTPPFAARPGQTREGPGIRFSVSREEEKSIVLKQTLISFLVSPVNDNEYDDDFPAFMND